jgi:hypothetical protein
MKTMINRTLCLCCASYYDAERDCPRAGEEWHTLELALGVSHVLLEQGINHPDKHDVSEALRELGHR